jgi:hypothetical protein
MSYYYGGLVNPWVLDLEYELADILEPYLKKFGKAKYLKEVSRVRAKLLKFLTTHPMPMSMRPGARRMN